MRILILIFVLSLSGCATKLQKKSSTSLSKELILSNQDVSPQDNLIASESLLVDHKFFKIAYDPQRRLAKYVWYQLSADQLKSKHAKRKDKFIPDPTLKKQKIPYVESSEYAKTGYDRGHLAPSADFAWDQEANNLTFVMSNMVPQTPSLNRDAWKRLEDQVRRWACGEEKITVITGPILSKNLPRLKSGLEIPQQFFKIIIDETPPKKIISFLYHQKDKGDVLAERVVPVKNVEFASGIAFNKKFPSMVDEKMRKPASLNEWKEADCVQ